MTPIIEEQLVQHKERQFDGVNPAKYMTVHETGNFRVGANAQAHADVQKRNDVRNASWHIQSDDSRIIRSFPNTTQCWHAGDGQGDGNLSSIGWEICVNPDSDFAKAVELAAQGMAQVMKQEDIPLSHLVQHNNWSGKNCPQRIRSGSHGINWTQFLDRVSRHLGEKMATTISGMVSPVQGYLTQAYRAGAHLGMDIGTGGVKRDVVAAFAGRVIQVYKGAKHGDTKSTWAAGRTSNAVIIQNIGAGSSGDGEYQAYGHVTGSVKVGDQVEAGDVIGVLDNSGRWTGWHLHFEMWSRHKAPYDPQLAFNRWGIKVGAKPKATNKPVPKPPVSKPKPPVVGKASVLAKQKNLNKYAKAGLYEDGVEGAVTKAWFKWVKELQRALPAWRGVPKLVVDENYGSETANAVKILQSNNGLVPDGVAGDITINYMRRHGSKVSNRPKNRP